MADLENLEARIKRLEDIEAIKRVKAKYWWCQDKKLWNEMLDCFTEDAYLQYGTKLKLPSAKTAAQFFEGDSIGRPSTLSVHQGHNAEIDVSMDGTTAKARWEVYVYIIDEQDKKKRLHAGYYEDDFVKQGGKWKIKRLLFTPFLTEGSTWDSQL